MYDKVSSGHCGTAIGMMRLIEGMLYEVENIALALTNEPSYTIGANHSFELHEVPLGKHCANKSFTLLGSLSLCPLYICLSIIAKGINHLGPEDRIFRHTIKDQLSHSS